jgi:hypothetical protein
MQITYNVACAGEIKMYTIFLCRKRSGDNFGDRLVAERMNLMKTNSEDVDYLKLSQNRAKSKVPVKIVMKFRVL